MPGQYPIYDQRQSSQFNNQMNKGPPKKRNSVPSDYQSDPDIIKKLIDPKKNLIKTEED